MGWATSANNDTPLALDALARATRSRMPQLGLVHHSDRGSVYASGDYRAALKAFGAVASMSRKGDCWDNAVAESFFATIKGEMIDDRDFETRAEANAAIGDYIDAFYNVTRMHSTIGYVSPIEFELKLKSRRGPLFVMNRGAVSVAIQNATRAALLSGLRARCAAWQTHHEGRRAV